MNERGVWSLVVIVTAALFLNLGLGLAEERVLVNGIDANFPPFALVDKTGVPGGFDEERWSRLHLGVVAGVGVADERLAVAGGLDDGVAEMKRPRTGS